MQPLTFTQFEGLHLLTLSWLEIVVQPVCLYRTLQTPQTVLVLQNNRLLAYCFRGWIFTGVLCFPLQLVPVVSEVGRVQDNPLVCGKKVFILPQDHRIIYVGKDP